MWCHQVVTVVPLSSSCDGRSGYTQNSDGGDPGCYGDGNGDQMVTGLSDDVQVNHARFHEF